MNEVEAVLVSTKIGAGFIVVSFLEDNVVRLRLFWGPPTDSIGHIRSQARDLAAAALMRHILIDRWPWSCCCWSDLSHCQSFVAQRNAPHQFAPEKPLLSKFKYAAGSGYLNLSQHSSYVLWRENMNIWNESNTWNEIHTNNTQLVKNERNESFSSKWNALTRTNGIVTGLIEFPVCSTLFVHFCPEEHDICVSFFFKNFHFGSSLLRVANEANFFCGDYSEY
jgi:hypothetical protein